MSEKWEDDLETSTQIFQESVYPEIQHFFGDGELIPVEAVTDNEMADTLDKHAGIDFWFVEAGKGMFGIASRVQDGGTDWGTFTVRRRRFSGADTEFEKRQRQLDNDYLTPRFTCQAYTDGYDFINAAVVRTRDLIDFIAGGARGNEYIVRETHNADFFVVDWADLNRQYDVQIHN